MKSMAELLCQMCGKLFPAGHQPRHLMAQRLARHLHGSVSQSFIIKDIKGAKSHLKPASRLICSAPSKWEQPTGYDTGIQIYHPVLKEKVPLILKKKKVAQWYACGPTVYDHTHIGHASSYVRLDIIRRILGSVFDIDSTLVIGITDIDDKIIQRAQESGQDWRQMTKFYEKEFFNHMTDLNVTLPPVTKRVTDHIPQIVDFVRSIDHKGLAYTSSDGSVYFDVKKYNKYGVFASSDPKLGVVEDGSEKRHPQDFALWKGAKPGEPSWESPWGKGRPGWHVECSAMASDVFGSNFDLHSGGEDLIFPHHENELAQSTVCHGHDQWVNYWIHTGHLYLAGQSDKMSKSLKNTITVPQLLEQYTPNQFRMLCLLSNYRKKIEFSESRMDKAVSTMKTLNSVIRRCESYVNGEVDCGNIPEVELYEKLDQTRLAVEQAFADDFNTPKALAQLMRLVKFTNQVLREETDDKDNDDKDNDKDIQDNSVRCNAPVAAVGIYTRRLLKQLGLDIGRKRTEEDTQTHLQFFKAVESVVGARARIRSFTRDKEFMMTSADSVGIPQDKAEQLMKKLYVPLWEASDTIRRDIYQSANVQINDTATGYTWNIADFKKSGKVEPTTINLKSEGGKQAKGSGKGTSSKTKE